MSTTYATEYWSPEYFALKSGKTFATLADAASDAVKAYGTADVDQVSETPTEKVFEVRLSVLDPDPGRARTQGYRADGAFEIAPLDSAEGVVRTMACTQFARLRYASPLWECYRVFTVVLEV